MDVRTCYVLASWGGERRVDFGADPAFYLREHLVQLEGLTNHLDHVVVVNNQHMAGNHEVNYIAGYDEFLASLRDHTRLGTASFEILDRPNQGLSYGAWSDAYGRYRTDFDFYFFVEDDYVFVRDGFDHTCREVIESFGPQCAYVAAFTHGINFPRHAAIPSGIVRATAIESLWMKHGRLRHFVDPLGSRVVAGYSMHELDGNVGQSHQFIEEGFTIEDWLDDYATVIHRMPFDFVRMAQGEGPDLMASLPYVRGLVPEVPEPLMRCRRDAILPSTPWTPGRALRRTQI